MEYIREIIDSLNKDKLRHINLINFIENNPIICIEPVEDSWIVRGISDRTWVYIVCSSKSELAAIRGRLNKEDKCFAAVEEWMVPVLIADKELLWEQPLTQFYLPEDVCLPEAVFHTRSLSEEDARTVYDNSEYGEYISVEYTKDRIRKGISRGLYENGKPAGWGLTHDDGGLGFLHVLKDKRKKGYGLSITVSLIEEVRRAGKIPFAYIEKDNYKSINLVSKLGFIKCRNCCWFQIR